MKIIEKIVNISSGKETLIERDETAGETKYRLDSEKAQSDLEIKNSEFLKSKFDLLKRLGISEEEAKLLLS